MASSADEPGCDVDFPAEEDYEHLIEDYSHLAPPSEGELLQGHVVKVTPQEVIVDFGYKLEGLVPIEQVRQPDGTVTVQGRRRHRCDDRPPAARSRKATSCSRYSQASRLRIWDKLEQAMRDQLLVSGPGARAHQGRPDGGCRRARVHARLAGRSAARFTIWISSSARIFRSRFSSSTAAAATWWFRARLAIEEDLQGRASRRALEHLSEGAVVTGTVKNLTEYGAFVDLGGIDGLLHVSDMSHGRVNHPSEVVHVGDEVTVKDSQVRPRKRAHFAGHAPA